VVGKETKFHPQGWTVGDFIEFKKGTTITLNELGEVISGVLAKDTFLYPRGWARVINDYYYITAYSDPIPYGYRFHHRLVDRSYNMAIPGYNHLQFKGGTAVTFSQSGDILTGTIVGTAVLRLVEGKYGFISCRANSVLTFYDSGAIQSAVLAEDTYLRPFNWQKLLRQPEAAGFVKFCANKPITFNETGDVVTGTLKEPAKLVAGDGQIKEFAANTAVRFTEQGAIAEITVDMP
jgi:hypothetical protein